MWIHLEEKVLQQRPSGDAAEDAPSQRPRSEGAKGTPWGQHPVSLWHGAPGVAEEPHMSGGHWHQKRMLAALETAMWVL